VVVVVVVNGVPIGMIRPQLTQRNCLLVIPEISKDRETMNKKGLEAIARDAAESL